ncbi:cytochrome ubiquinol oxidase subunit II [Pusillimonas sp. CC-YST705]|uniref:Cytochrome ubiquinol oxidase subunit II n=1 Tax=Mesopusillimonas faecipullorum TaxID=2755040 RepID=A0ABS8CCW7_9BURK|nr:hypothetical protein [Mesopusillimonas faecipullorum]MCB5363869.1 cytochrome ubiquinol oxidase subunit II [Mesopusillimonas faecipullorum]
MANLKKSMGSDARMNKFKVRRLFLFGRCQVNHRAWPDGIHRNAVIMMLAVISLLLMCAPVGAEELHMSFLNPQGIIADKQMQHWWLVVAILLAFVALPVFVAVTIIMFRYRYSAAKKAGRKYSPHWNFFAPLEFINWGGPLVIVIIIGTLVWQSTEDLDPYRPIASAEAPTKVQVIGYDWKWLFIYPELGIASVGTLAFPADRPLSMELTTAGNMQSLWVPALGSQIYAMAGMVTKLNYAAYQPGRFLGMNTMYNGDGFHEQKFTAVAMTDANFDQWVEQARTQGQPFNAKAVQTLSQRANQKALSAAFPQASTADGSVYFTEVDKHFFHKVVMQMMEDGVDIPPGYRAPNEKNDALALALLATCSPGSDYVLGE